MSGERVHVIGPDHRVAIIGSILAQRWAGEGRELVLSPDRDATTDATIITRPDQSRFHAELGMTFEDLVQNAEATPVFAVEAHGVDDTIELPFSPFGMAKSGVEFHQFWMRGNARQQQSDLTEFSLALAMQQAPAHAQVAAIGKLPLQFGLQLNGAKYAVELLKVAVSNGAQIAESSNVDDADLTMDCRPSTDTADWLGNTLTLASDRDIPGIEWQICVNAARRFLALTPSLSDCENEQREYSRLAAGESERIADMRALLTDPEPQETSRPALKRKIDVFAACGRIQTEDFEVFGQPEWLAALWARGIRPRRFDRMAKAMPEAELLGWLASLQREVGQITQQRQPA